MLLFYTECEVRQYEEDSGGTVEKLCFALNNGIETSAVRQLRAPYDASGRLRDLVFIGRLEKKARLELIIEALATDRCSKVSLDVIGGGPDVGRLKSLAVSLGVDARVHWHAGTIDERKIASVMNRSKLFIYPGSVGLSLIHGLSYGLPAIIHGNRRTHMPECCAFKKGINGFDFEEGSVSSLSDVISAALSDTSRLSAMSESALNLIDRTYNAEDMCNRFCDVFDRIEAA
ncbi:glycosyltransferase [Mesorhizobium sp. M0984]|uniref:glycosyltransferase n=1 Tax=Mesorhizobium sp. M0984 TaxID=2957041 RepID=UPI00333AFB7D